jgi:hypothetical protein
MHKLIVCNTCKKSLKLDDSQGLTNEIAAVYADKAVYETYVGISYTDAQKITAMTCPRCKVSDVTSGDAIWLYRPTVFVRGSGLVNDRAGAKRDMNIYHLTAKDSEGKTIDPYDDMRQPGEVDDMVKKFKKPKKSKTNIVDMKNITQDAVDKAVSS